MRTLIRTPLRSVSGDHSPSFRVSDVAKNVEEYFAEKKPLSSFRYPPQKTVFQDLLIDRSLILQKHPISASNSLLSKRHNHLGEWLPYHFSESNSEFCDSAVCLEKSIEGNL
jgi:hypothetical protein